MKHILKPFFILAHITMVTLFVSCAPQSSSLAPGARSDYYRINPLDYRKTGLQAPLPVALGEPQVQTSLDANTLRELDQSISEADMIVVGRDFYGLEFKDLAQNPSGLLKELGLKLESKMIFLILDPNSEGLNLKAIDKLSFSSDGNSWKNLKGLMSLDLRKYKDVPKTWVFIENEDSAQAQRFALWQSELGSATKCASITDFEHKDSQLTSDECEIVSGFDLISDIRQASDLVGFLGSQTNQDGWIEIQKTILENYNKTESFTAYDKSIIFPLKEGESLELTPVAEKAQNYNISDKESFAILGFNQVDYLVLPQVKIGDESAGYWLAKEALETLLETRAQSDVIRIDNIFENLDQVRIPDFKIHMDGVVKKKRFLDFVWPAAVEIQKRTGLPARALAIHAALESGWGEGMKIFQRNISGAIQNTYSNLFIYGNCKSSEFKGLNIDKISKKVWGDSGISYQRYCPSKSNTGDNVGTVSEMLHPLESFLPLVNNAININSKISHWRKLKSIAATLKKAQQDSSEFKFTDKNKVVWSSPAGAYFFSLQERSCETRVSTSEEYGTASSITAIEQYQDCREKVKTIIVNKQLLIAPDSLTKISISKNGYATDPFYFGKLWGTYNKAIQQGLLP